MYDQPQSQETLMQRPFELSGEELRERLEEMVQITISDLVSEFLLMPMGRVAPQLIVVTHTSARSDVAGPVKDAHDALVVPSELAGHEMRAVRVSSSDGR